MRLSEGPTTNSPNLYKGLCSTGTLPSRETQHCCRDRGSAFVYTSVVFTPSYSYSGKAADTGAVHPKRSLIAFKIILTESEFFYVSLLL